MNKKYLFYMLFLLLFVAFSCKKDEPVKEYDKTKGVFICNEGNFTYGNGSLSFYEPETQQVENQIFYHANNFPLGDVVQSMKIYNKNAYIVVNNSGKIMVMDADNFLHQASISGFTSPRYIEFIDEHKMYVTDLYSPFINIVDLQTNEISGQIMIGASTEQMLRVGNYIYVTSWSYNNKVYKINCLRDEVVDSVEVAKQPNSIEEDVYGRLWVLSDGGYDGSPYGHELAALSCINPVEFTVIKELKFPTLNSSPTELQINKTKDTLYYILGDWSGQQVAKNGVYKMCVHDDVLPTSAFIPQKNHLFYGLGIDPENSEVYVSDAIDYQQSGIIFRYQSNGIQIDSFFTDIVPGFFWFKNVD